MFKETESAIRIIPKARPASPFWLNVVFFFSAGLLGIVLLFFSYFFWQARSLDRETKLFSQEIEKLENSDEKRMEIQLQELAAKIEAFDSLFHSRKTTAEIFGLVKRICHPQVQFTSLDFTSDGRRLVLDGKTDNFMILAEQQLILRSDRLIDNLQLTKASLDKDGKTIFSFSFSLTE